MESFYLCLVTLCVLSVGTIMMKSVFAGNISGEDAALPQGIKAYLFLWSGTLIISSVYIYLACLNIGNILLADYLRPLTVMVFLPFVGLVDYKLLIIPNKMTLCMLGVRLILVIADFVCYEKDVLTVLLAGLASSVVGGAVFFLPRLFSTESVGMGDIKLVLVAGLFYNLAQLFVFLFFSLLLSSMTGIFLMAVKKKSKKTPLPFAPFFSAGAIACALLFALQ